ncbi:hypothetical protein [Vibrio breoganii]|nr:hypothetical protein [Vibrio breoganii]
MYNETTSGLIKAEQPLTCHGMTGTHLRCRDSDIIAVHFSIAKRVEVKK